jgi:hypothetical protein
VGFLETAPEAGPRRYSFQKRRFTAVVGDPETSDLAHSHQTATSDRRGLRVASPLYYMPSPADRHFTAPRSGLASP